MIVKTTILKLDVNEDAIIYTCCILLFHVAIG